MALRLTSSLLKSANGQSLQQVNNNVHSQLMLDSMEYCGFGQTKIQKKREKKLSRKT